MSLSISINISKNISYVALSSNVRFYDIGNRKSWMKFIMNNNLKIQ